MQLVVFGAKKFLDAGAPVVLLSWLPSGHSPGAGAGAGAGAGQGRGQDDSSSAFTTCSRMSGQ